MINDQFFLAGSKCFPTESKIYMVSRIRDIWSWEVWKTTSSERNVRSSHQKKQNNPLRARVWIKRLYFTWCIWLRVVLLKERWQILLSPFSLFFHVYVFVEKTNDWYLHSARITISCRMNFDDYPLDAHTCQFQVGSCKYYSHYAAAFI